jgi:hypothetical protein
MSDLGGTVLAMDALTDLERGVLDIEARLFLHPGAKQLAAAQETGLSWPRYQQIVNALIDRPAALQHAPVVVNRLRRLRATRRSARRRSA